MTAWTHSTPVSGTPSNERSPRRVAAAGEHDQSLRAFTRSTPNRSLKTCPRCGVARGAPERRAAADDALGSSDTRAVVPVPISWRTRVRELLSPARAALSARRPSRRHRVLSGAAPLSGPRACTPILRRRAANARR